ncbi:MAG: hypothetical protein BWK76_01835 [Desulfobulbaceae bacterium A2]|nr:MAG: hypothetical protein BWK76_01835 [Desulfobulbaceae bacterium A2]
MFPIDPVQTLLFVDDEPLILKVIDRLLRQRQAPWRCLFAGGVDEALSILAREPVDAVISDIMMPVRDGFDLLAALRNDPKYQDLPVVILTGLNDPGLKSRALDLGATDLLNKPMDPADLMSRIRSVLRLKRCQDDIKRQNTQLESLVRQRTAALAATRLDIIWRLGKAAEFRSEETGNHVIRVSYYSKLLAERLGLPRDEVETIFHTSPLHDLGKIGIPDRILLKPAPLDPEEWRLMQTHCRIGYDLLSQQSSLPFGDDDLGLVLRREHNPFLDISAAIACSHHERWDGSGYPAGLRGEAIPLAARIVAVSDVFDALGSRRVYKESYSTEQVLAIMRQCNGTHFDPAVFAAFEVRLLGRWLPQSHNPLRSRGFCRLRGCARQSE